MRSCSPHIIRLTSLHLCCAILLRLLSYRSSTPIHALPHHRTDGTQQTAQFTTSRREAPLAVLATNTLQAGWLPSSASQLQSSRFIRPGQLCRRTEPTYQRVAQLPTEDRPRKHEGHPSPPHTTAGAVSFAIAADERDRTHDTRRPQDWGDRAPFLLSAASVYASGSAFVRIMHVR